MHRFSHIFLFLENKSLVSFQMLRPNKAETNNSYFLFFPSLPYTFPVFSEKSPCYCSEILYDGFSIPGNCLSRQNIIGREAISGPVYELFRDSQKLLNLTKPSKLWPLTDCHQSNRETDDCLVISQTKNIKLRLFFI